MKRDDLLKYWNKTQVIHDMNVIDAFLYVPREKFMPSSLKQRAYEDIALPLSHGQTISQPSTVARMISLLKLKKSDSVLEIGTGSGWNAALISKLVAGSSPLPRA